MAKNHHCFFSTSISADESDTGIGLCGWLLTAISWALVMVTLPFSLCVCFKVRRLDKTFKYCTWYIIDVLIFQVVQEYERAVIFRLGRLLSGGSRGPGEHQLNY